MWAGRPRVGNGAMHINRCRNEEIIVKGNFGWAWPMWAGPPRISCIVIREVQYQFEVNRCRNEEIIVKGNFGWAWPKWSWPMWAALLRVEVQYQFEVNRCRNEEIIVKGNFGWAWPMWPGRPRIALIVIREAQYQFEFQGSSGQDGRTDAHQYNIPTFSPKNVRIVILKQQYVHLN
ncbi:hypothetical protein DPMN_098590 [Dreissena polymorpha]|uniref:Uncharacterized protein n=1 Tax=Dreissena polymorpha TaxID=45954 RepID=A0A9D4LCG8_DREPO|nr:hypothetical protein DPMN_098590 [Dreissena polymorpha]